MDHAWSWLALLLLGAFHGINPGMGWLFAVALGLQERSRRAVLRALAPLALGHALAIGAAVVAALLLEAVLPPKLLKLPVAAILVTLGGWRLYRHRHPSGGGMRVGMAGLALWSFLMASAHGAGLMVVPVFLSLAPPAAAAAGHHHYLHGAAASMAGWTAAAATLVHGAGYLLVTALAAVIVYEKVGIGILRTAWVNVDLIWAAALILTGLAALAIG